jgi:hypothetical protein
LCVYVLAVAAGCGGTNTEYDNGQGGPRGQQTLVHAELIEKPLFYLRETTLSPATVNSRGLERSRAEPRLSSPALPAGMVEGVRRWSLRPE